MEKEIENLKKCVLFLAKELDLARKTIDRINNLDSWEREESKCEIHIGRWNIDRYKITLD